MKTKTKATIEDLYRTEGQAELVDGEIIHMSPTGKLPNHAAGEIFVSLHQFVKLTQIGHAATDNLAFVVNLPRRKSFSPDVAFYVGELTMKFAQGAPIFAVEVRSAEDYGPAAERHMAEKRKDYFAAGTRVVWDVDLQGEDVVRVYRADNSDQPTIYRRGEVAEAEPAVPGWAMAVDELFPSGS